MSYKVENTREGQVLDYDKLTMAIETNGSITGEDAVAFAARILQDQLGVFVELIEAGKILQFGLSEVSVDELEAARKILPVATVQNLYNVSNRQSEALLNHCTEQGIGFIPWFPIATGQLAAPDGPLSAISERTGHAPATLALAWLLRRSPVMLPIPGTKTVSHLEENCAASEVVLDDATYAELDALVSP